MTFTEWELVQADAWWSTLMVSDRWLLDAEHAAILHDNDVDLRVRVARVWRAEGNTAPPIPCCYYDPPSKCRCAKCAARRGS